MARTTRRGARGKAQPPEMPEPILVRCTMRIPRKAAERVLPSLGLAFGCGGATMRRTRSHVEVDAAVEIRTVGTIVGHGVPVLVTERIPVEPIPPGELVHDAKAWFKQVRRRP